MALVGQVGEYVGGKKDIASYIERVELYIAANYVEADYKVATFIAFIRADAYGVLRNLLAPERPKDKSFVQQYEKLTERFGNPALISESLINNFLEISADQHENNLTTRATHGAGFRPATNMQKIFAKLSPKIAVR